MIKEKLPNDKIYRYKVDGRFTDDLPGVTAYVMRDYSIGMHIQDFFEINIVTRGYGMHYIGEGCAAASVGDVFIIPPHVRHGYTGGKGFDVSHFIVSDGFIKHNIAKDPAFLHSIQRRAAHASAKRRRSLASETRK